MDIGHAKFQTADYKLEFWKGQYGKMYGFGISSGCEIGLYYKQQILWKCATDKARRLRMRMTLYKKGYSKSMFVRDSKTSTRQGKAWWLSAFQPEIYMPGGKSAKPEKLKMTATIWFDSCNRKYYKQMMKLSKKLSGGDSENPWGRFVTYGSKSWRKKTISWNYR